MRQQHFLILGLFMLLFCFLILSFNFPKVRATDGLPVHNVNTGMDYATIQEAINAAETLDGHIIKVGSGTYYEQVAINKSISLITQNGDMPTIDGGGTETVVAVTANDVAISGFKIINGQAGTAILLDHSLNCNLYNNNLTDSWYGVIFRSSNYTDFTQNNVTSNFHCILLSSSRNNAIIENNIIAHDGKGISLSGDSSNNSIVRNSVIGSKQAGVYFSSCKYNVVAENDLFNNSLAIYFTDSSNNTIYHNNCMSTVLNVFIRNLSGDTKNTWDDGYPSGGNYYSSYAGRDRYSGSYQNETESDGIGDTAYKIEGDTQDNYPLIGMYHRFNVTSIYSVQTICNSTISSFNYNGTAIIFYVSGDDGTAGFCRVCILTALMNGTYRVFINGTEVAFNLLSSSNSTHSYLYFTYNHSTQDVIIIPEISYFLLMLVFMIGMSAVVVCRRNYYYC